LLDGADRLHREPTTPRVLVAFVRIDSFQDHVLVGMSLDAVATVHAAFYGCRTVPCAGANANLAVPRLRMCPRRKQSA